jgi:hypothetical protein
MCVCVCVCVYVCVCERVSRVCVCVCQCVRVCHSVCMCVCAQAAASLSPAARPRPPPRPAPGARFPARGPVPAAGDSEPHRPHGTPSESSTRPGCCPASHVVDGVPRPPAPAPLRLAAPPHPGLPRNRPGTPRPLPSPGRVCPGRRQTCEIRGGGRVQPYSVNGQIIIM